MTAYVGAIDQGTTSTRFMVFGRSGRVIAGCSPHHPPAAEPGPR